MPSWGGRQTASSEAKVSSPELSAVRKIQADSQSAVEAANKAKVKMIFTGLRHFNH